MRLLIRMTIGFPARSGSPAQITRACWRSARNELVGEEFVFAEGVLSAMDATTLVAHLHRRDESFRYEEPAGGGGCLNMSTDVVTQVENDALASGDFAHSCLDQIQDARLVEGENAEIADAIGTQNGHDRVRLSCCCRCRSICSCRCSRFCRCSSLGSFSSSHDFSPGEIVPSMTPASRRCSAKRFPRRQSSLSNRCSNESQFASRDVSKNVC